MISGILLAAGTSSRMGKENKLLLPYEGKMLLMRALETLKNSNLGEIIVVLGYEYEILKPLLINSGVKIGINHQYASGQTSSIKNGLKLINQDSSAFMICLSDMPYLTCENINALIEEYKTIHNSQGILQPWNKIRPGNPVIFSIKYYDELLNCEDPNGCKSVIERFKNELYYFKTEDQAYFFDIDTKEEYIISKGND